MFSETKKFKAQEDKLKSVFEVLTLIDHPNIVKFHRFSNLFSSIVNGLLLCFQVLDRSWQD